MSDIHMQVCVNMGWCYCGMYRESEEPSEERIDGQELSRVFYVANNPNIAKAEADHAVAEDAASTAAVTEKRSVLL